MPVALPSRCAPKEPTGDCPGLDPCPAAPTPPPDPPPGPPGQPGPTVLYCLLLAAPDPAALRGALTRFARRGDGLVAVLLHALKGHAEPAPAGGPPAAVGWCGGPVPMTTTTDTAMSKSDSEGLSGHTHRIVSGKMKGNPLRNGPPTRCAWTGGAAHQGLPGLAAPQEVVLYPVLHPLTCPHRNPASADLLTNIFLRVLRVLC